MKEILVLYYSSGGATAKIAKLIARGIESIDGVTARLRTVPPVSPVCEKVASDVPERGDSYVTLQDLEECIGIAMGTPSYFGNMASALKYFWDSTTSIWVKGSLIGKPACVFTSAGSMHGGQESCLISMMLPLIHHGMVIVGIPYNDSSLMTTLSGGTPYGVSHYAGMEDNLPITEVEHKFAFSQGKRLAEIALKLVKV